MVLAMRLSVHGREYLSLCEICKAKLLYQKFKIQSHRLSHSEVFPILNFFARGGHHGYLGHHWPENVEKVDPDLVLAIGAEVA